MKPPSPNKTTLFTVHYFVLARSWLRIFFFRNTCYPK